MFGRGLVAAFALWLAGCAAYAQSEQPPEEFFAKTPAEFRPFVETCKPWDEWDKPAPPFKIHGNTYYVGTCGIAAILIAGDDGHVLIDSGTEAGARIVLDNIRTLGFEPNEVEALLHSHEHFDHVGGHSVVQQASGATIIPSMKSSEVLRTGISARNDPQFGMHDPMSPVQVGRPIQQGEAFAINGLGSFVAIDTPGHTPGALSWQWESCEGDQCLTIVYADSLSPVSSDDYNFSDHPEYLVEYFAGLERLSELQCDILLTPHPSHSRMLRRMRDNEMIEPAACVYYAIGKANDLEARLEREAGGDQ